MDGTIGQPVAGHATSAHYTLDEGFWAIAGAPYLWAVRTPTNTVLLYWWVGGLSCVLLESPTMAANSWTTVGPTPVQAGDKMQVIMPPSAGKKFYRLRTQ